MLVGPFYCILCRKVEEELDHIFRRSKLASSVWDSFYHTLGVVVACHKDFCAMIEEFLLNPLCGEGHFLSFSGMSAIL